MIELFAALYLDEDVNALVARLLEEHYDPAYRRSAARNFAKLPQAPVLRVPAADDAEDVLLDPRRVRRPDRAPRDRELLAERGHR